jgi:HAD superfamily hydrolase (TIGR01509 family)
LDFLKDTYLKYSLVIFDCDGVLVDSESIGCKVISEMITEQGLPMTPEEADQNFTGGNWYSTVAYVEERIGRKLPEDFEREYRLRSARAFEKDLKPIRGIEDLIKSLSINICVGSNGPREKILPNLRITGLDKYFNNNNIFSAYDIKKWKPDPGLYLHAADRMGFQPTDCIVVEDTIHGVRAAKAAGMRVLGYGGHGRGDELSQNGACVIDHMHEFHNAVKLL